MLRYETINLIKENFKDASYDSLKDVFVSVVSSYIHTVTCRIITIYNGYDVKTIHTINNIVKQLDIVIYDDGSVEIYCDSRDMDYIKINCPELFNEIKIIQKTFFETFNYLLDKEEYILC